MEQDRLQTVRRGDPSVAQTHENGIVNEWDTTVSDAVFSVLFVRN